MPDPRVYERDDQEPPLTDQEEEAALKEPIEDESDLEDEPPDGTILMGMTGVEEEVLAELARAEAELSNPSAPDEPEGEEDAQV